MKRRVVQARADELIEELIEDIGQWRMISLPVGSEIESARLQVEALAFIARGVAIIAMQRSGDDD
jgi:hypothetical protein